jgi:hypothetical protein
MGVPPCLTESHVAALPPGLTRAELSRHAH